MRKGSVTKGNWREGVRLKRHWHSHPSQPLQQKGIFPTDVSYYYVFQRQSIALFFANDSRNVGSPYNFYTIFLDPEVIFSSHTMFINAFTKEFTLIYLVTFSISCSSIRMNFNEVLLRL